MNVYQIQTKDLGMIIIDNKFYLEKINLMKKKQNKKVMEILK